MEEEDIEKAVIAYLKKKGFKQTELAFQEEQSKSSSSNASQTDPDIAKHLLSFSEYAPLSLSLFDVVVQRKLYS
ncbi:LisH dimerization motif [Macleaya cordata]|uniref:LisH dimerization motif n=1 Tax=Macleaya cordata TaxID=56857 RepID=A0A200QHZ7_MACCD|nr:LisH dimerization motif [Macleaya cordata]